MNIITWNVQWFCGLDGKIDIQRVVNRAKDIADFDVLCLQEVAVNYPRLDGDASHDQPAIVKSLLPDFDVFFAAAVDELAPDGRSRRRFGNLIATRLPALQFQQYGLPYPADTTPGGSRSMPRVCAVVTIQTPHLPIRFMTTHLEFYSPTMRMAQTAELLRIHAQACAQAAYPPLFDDTGSPFQSKTHTPHCIIAGDFNFEPDAAEYSMMQAPQSTTAGAPQATRLIDAWTLARPGEAHAPTFQLHDRRYGPTPITCDFLFLSESLAGYVQRVDVDLETRASDHQPVLLTLGC
jgi:endonuclease/exonuclease/phosphatase family metal-dependent hydrolase